MNLKTASIAAAIALCLAASGCLSMWSEQCSREEILKARVWASGDQGAIGLINAGADGDMAIRAVPLKGGVGLGIDVSNLRALCLHPIRQLLAALGDAGAAAGAYCLARDISISDRHDTTINITGNGNTVTAGR